MEKPFYIKLKDGRSFYVEAMVNENLEVVYFIFSVSSIATQSVCLGEFSSYNCKNGYLELFDKVGSIVRVIEGPFEVDVVARVIIEG